MRPCTAIVCLLLPLAAAPAAAQQPEEELEPIVQELFITETVYPQDAGEVQFTVDSDLDDENLARLTTEYGITDRLQVSATTPVLTSDGSAGGWTLGALYNLVNHRSLAASVSVDAELSSGDEDVVVEPALIAATQVGTAQVHGTVSVSLASEPEYFGGLGVMLDAGFLTPTAEITASGQEHAPTTIGVTPGLYLHLGHHAEIGVAAPIRVHGDELPGLRALATIEF